MLPTATHELLQFGSCIAQAIHEDNLEAAAHEEFASKIDRLARALTAVDNSRNTTVLATKRLSLADKTLKTWLAKARLVVMLARGSRWSESWIHTGFTDRRTKIPKRLDDRMALAKALVAFFARHPEFGVAFADVTAARGRAIYERVLQSREMLQFSRDESATVRRECQTAAAELRAAIRKTAGVRSATGFDRDQKVGLRHGRAVFRQPDLNRHCRSLTDRRFLRHHCARHRGTIWTNGRSQLSKRTCVTFFSARKMRLLDLPRALPLIKSCEALEK